MKKAFFVGLACLALALSPDVAFAAAKKKTVMAKGGGACTTTGTSCATNCTDMGWCSRLVCANGKWEKRMVSCVAPFCPPKC